jgi:hypothetical protein
MSIIFPWPFSDQVDAFEMRILNNTESYTSPYTKDTQVVDLLGEKWLIRVDLPSRIEDTLGAAREAFFDRLNGPVNLVSLWHLKRQVPRGTFRGGTTSAGILQLSNVATLSCATGTTLKAGDHILLGTQLVRCMADTVSVAGAMPIEFLPRARTGILSGTTIGWNKPSANFMLTTNGVPTVWRQGRFDGTSLDFIEVP